MTQAKGQFQPMAAEAFLAYLEPLLTPQYRENIGIDDLRQCKGDCPRGKIAICRGWHVKPGTFRRIGGM